MYDKMLKRLYESRDDVREAIRNLISGLGNGAEVRAMTAEERAEYDRLEALEADLTETIDRTERARNSVLVPATDAKNQARLRDAFGLI